MARRNDHLRKKAIQLRVEHNMTLNEIVERLKLPKTTVYGWIKHIPIPRTVRQTEAQQRGTAAMQAKYAALREDAYQQGLDEAPELLKDPRFRDFVVLYMAEGYKKGLNTVSFVNSDPAMIVLANEIMTAMTTNKMDYAIQYHVDLDVDGLRTYWAEMLDIDPAKIKLQRKSNSGKMNGRNWRSEYGVLTVRVGDTYLRQRLQAWMDTVKSQW